MIYITCFLSQNGFSITCSVSVAACKISSETFLSENANAFDYFVWDFSTSEGFQDLKS